MTLAFNTRFVKPEAFAGDSDKPFDYSNTDLTYGEAKLAVEALIKYAPQANLVFLSNAPVWKDVDTIKDAIAVDIQMQIQSGLRLRSKDSDDYYADNWVTDY